MTATIYSDVLFIVLALTISALLGFLIGWLMRSVRLIALKKSLDTCYKNNEKIKKQILANAEEKEFNSQIESAKN